MRKLAMNISVCCNNPLYMILIKELLRLCSLFFTMLLFYSKGHTLTSRCGIKRLNVYKSRKLLQLINFCLPKWKFLRSHLPEKRNASLNMVRFRLLHHQEFFTIWQFHINSTTWNYKRIEFDIPISRLNVTPLLSIDIIL